MSFEIGQHYRTGCGTFTRTITDIDRHPLGGRAIWWVDNFGTGVCRSDIFSRWVKRNQAELVQGGGSRTHLWASPDHLADHFDGEAVS